jgi:hypothetical protein
LDDGETESRDVIKINVSSSESGLQFFMIDLQYRIGSLIYWYIYYPQLVNYNKSFYLAVNCEESRTKRLLEKEYPPQPLSPGRGA